MNFGPTNSQRTQGTSGSGTLAVIAALACSYFMTSIPGIADDHANGRRRPPELPSPLCDDVNPPEGARVRHHLYASGFQIYRWNGSQWVFVAPEAALYADPCYEAQVGIHYAGPTWELNDRSKVTGVRLAGCAPSRGTIPWLLLAATPSSEGGRFGKVTHIQRVNTVGGTAPAEPGSNIGEEARVPYTAEYHFFVLHGTRE